MTRHLAMQRFRQWTAVAELDSIPDVSVTKAVDFACDPSGGWRGAALFVSDAGEWTLFQDLSGGFGFIPGASWLDFARSDSFFLAGYNDAIATAELISIENGRVVREFRYDHAHPEEKVDAGTLPFEDHAPLQTWVDVASVIDDDPLGFAETGLLLILDGGGPANTVGRGS